MRYHLFPEGVFTDLNKIGSLFSVNTQSGVTAVCTNRAVYDTITEYAHKVGEGVVGASERVILLVRPAFTVANSEFIQRPIHTTGRPNGWNNLIQVILAKMYSLPKYHEEGGVPLDPEMVEKAGEILFQRDPRIYVPFADNYSPLWQLYSATSIQKFHDTMLAEVPVLH